MASSSHTTSSAPELCPLKRPVPEDNTAVRIRILCQVHKTLTFKVKSHLPLKRFADMYFSRASVARGDVDLTYNGERLNLQRTPDEYGMKGEVTVEAMVISHGGGN